MTTPFPSRAGVPELPAVLALLLERHRELRGAAEAAVRHMLDLPGVRDPDGLVALKRLFAALQLNASYLDIQPLRDAAEAGERAVDRLLLSSLPPTESIARAIADGLALVDRIVQCHAKSDRCSEDYRPELARVIANLRAEPPVVVQSVLPDSLSDHELFVADSARLLAMCERALEALRDSDHRPERVHEAYRAMHTLKGNAALMGFEDVEGLARTAEHALEGLRSAELVPTPELCDALLGLVRCARKLGQEGTPLDWSSEARALNDASAHAQWLARRTRLGEVLIEHQLVAREDVELALAIKREPLGQALVRLERLSEEQLKDALDIQRRIRHGEDVPTHPSSKDGPDLAAVDRRKIARLKQEIAQLQLKLSEVMARADGLHLLHDEIEQLGAVRALAESLDRVSLGTLYRKMSRAAGEISKAQHKRVQVSLSGADIELDPQMMERLSDVLLHLVRNAVHHGLEEEAERARAGKGATGALSIDARVDAGRLRLTISDDGRGLDRPRILERAIRLGRLSEEVARSLSDQEAYRLVFLAGLSTAEQVGDISGRGVGMNVVLHQVTEAGGSVDIETSPGAGTRFELTLPLDSTHA